METDSDGRLFEKTALSMKPKPHALACGWYHGWGRSERAIARALGRAGKTDPEVIVATKAHDVSATQVALNWLINFHGDTVVAIPGATKVRHAEQNVGAMTFTLCNAELSQIDDLSKQFM